MCVRGGGGRRGKGNVQLVCWCSTSAAPPPFDPPPIDPSPHLPHHPCFRTLRFAAGAGAAPAAPAEPVRMSLFNIYRSMLHSVSEEADYHFVFEGLARLLNNIPNADSTYLPYSTKKVQRGWLAISLRRLSCCFGAH